VSGKPVLRLESARRDEREAIRYYAAEAGLDVALRFREALRHAYRAIEERPAAGSPRYADIVGLEGLRSRKLGRFPFLLFYIERINQIEVWRILHAQRDVGKALAQAEDQD
jgi:toxin ParE1/3/4